MAKVHFIASDGIARTIDAQEGISLMENAVANGIDAIEAVCGGNAYCGTCRVTIDPAWQAVLGAATEVEQPMLDSVGDGDPALRLSCQIMVTAELDGLIVRTPETQS